MQKTERLARLLHLSATGKIFCLAASLLIGTAVSVCAGEPVMNLATTNLTPGSGTSLSITTSNPPGVSRPEAEMTAEFSTETPLQKPAKSGPGNFLPLVRQDRPGSDRSNVTFSVQAGYGRIWDEQSMLQKISAGHQETGCAYISANISF